MEDRGKISIILPTRDTARYLEECLDSILNQNYKNWELLAVNDASSDHSFEIIQEYASKDKRILALDNPKPGLVNALRFAYSKSTGELIQRMDSDDKMPASKLELMISEWKKHGTGSVITGATEYFTDEGEIGEGFRRYDAWLKEVARSNTHKHEIYRECVIPSNCWLVHREDFDAIGGFEHDTMPEDYDLCFRFYKGGLKIVGIDQVLHHWRDRADRISRTREEYRDNRFFELKVKYFLELEKEPDRPLVIWGAGRNGKDLVKLFQDAAVHIHWVCDNQKKIGKDIYDLRLHSIDTIFDLDKPQIIIAVSSPEDQEKIADRMLKQGLQSGRDFWFFS